MTSAPQLTPAKRAEHAARSERLARALRDNLRRRKEQTQARADAAAQVRTPDSATRDATQRKGAKPPA